jgi:hypothetical protein
LHNREKENMKAVLKIGFVAAFCLAGSAAYGQEPVKTLAIPASRGTVQPAPAKAEETKTEATKTEAAKTEKQQGRTGRKAAAPASTRQKAVEPAKKEEVQPVK